MANLGSSWRLAVVSALGALGALLWIRLGLYGFGLPLGAVWLLPLTVLAAFYLRRGRVADLGVLLTSFALVWTAFEALTWVNAASDPAVSIPGWTPIPFATAVALLVAALAITVSSARRHATQSGRGASRYD